MGLVPKISRFFGQIPSHKEKRNAIDQIFYINHSVSCVWLAIFGRKNGILCPGTLFFTLLHLVHFLGKIEKLYNFDDVNHYENTFVTFEFELYENALYLQISR